MKSPGLVDSEDPVSNLLCEQEARLSETFEYVTAALRRRGVGVAFATKIPNLLRSFAR